MANAHGNRNCIACGAERNKKDFYRIVKTSEGYELDLLQKMQGRGAYLCKSTDCLLNCFRKKSLNHSFHASLSIQELEKLKEALRQNGENL